MPDIGDFNPVNPLHPVNPAKKPEPRKHPRPAENRQRPVRKRPERTTDEEKRPHIDDYA